MHTLPELAGPVAALAYAPDGAYLAVGLRRGTIALWDLHAGRAGWSWAAHHAPLRALAISPDGKILASAGKDGVRLWDLTGGTPDAPTHRLSTSEATLAFSPDGARLAVSFPLIQRHEVRIWEFKAARWTRTLPFIHHSEPRVGSFSPDGTLLAVGMGICHALLWEPDSPGPNDLVFDIYRQEWRSPWNWRELFGQGRKASGQRPPLQYGSGTPAESLSFSAEGDRLATTAKSRIVIWDTAAAARIRTLTQVKERTAAVAFAPHGRVLASAHQQTIALWDPDAAQPLRARFASAAGRPQALAFSPDGTALAIGGAQGVALLDLDEGLTA
jgi:WD40 repeat protein